MKQELKISLTKYLLAALFGAIGGVITILVVVLLDAGIHALWENAIGMDTSNPTRTPAVFFSMAIVTLFISYIVYRYGKAKTGLEEIISDVVEKGAVEWRKLPKALLIAFPSILSGASLGPEAPAAIASVGISNAIADHQKLSIKNTQHANAAAFSGMLGSILSSPFLAPTMIAETAKQSAGTMKSLLTTSLIASAFGIATFFLIFGKIYSLNLPTQDYQGSGYYELIVAFIFGLLGCLFAIIAAKLIMFMNAVFDKVAKTDVQRIMFTGIVVSLLMFALPLTMFSGQHTLDDLYTYSLSAGFIVILLVGLIKMASTALLLRAGFIGGAVFPAVFAGTAAGLAFNQLFHVSPAVAISATSVGVITILLRKPLSAAILVLLFFGFSSGGAVACGLAGALLVLPLLPKQQ